MRARSHHRLALAAALAVATPACLVDATFADPPGPTTSTDDDFDIAMAYAPEDVHVGEVVTFTFRVRRGGEPVAGLSPAAAATHVASGAASDLRLSAAGPGEFTGGRPFFAAGIYQITLEFKDGGADVRRVWSVEASSH